MTEDEFDSTLVTVGGAVLASADPTGGVMTAIVSHALTTSSVDSAWRSATLDLWFDVLVEDIRERREQYQRTTDEFTRHRLILDWLREELESRVADLEGRVSNLETVALSLMAEGQRLLKTRSEPEMRPYLEAALRNTLKHRDRFPPTWVRRLVEVLEKIGADHLDFLQHVGSGGTLGEWKADRDVQEVNLMVDELVSANVLRRSADHSAVALSPIGLRLIKFVK